MIVLPIVGRELRVAARRSSTYRTRLWAALSAIALAAWKCLDFSWQGASSASQGHSLFYTLSGLAFVYCLGIGARVTSDCVSEEKRDGTLGLLFLTDLKGWDVVLGKLVASSLNSFYGLLAVFPLLAMPLLLGGVTFAQFGQMVVVLLNALFFSLAIGILISSLSTNDRKSMFATVVTTLAITFGPFCAIFFVIAVMEIVQNPGDLVRFIPWIMLNPLYPFLLSLPLPTVRFIAIPAWSFWVSIGAVHVLSWAFLLITAVLLPRIWKDRVRVVRPSSKKVSFLERWRRWAQGDTAQRRALRAELLGRNAFLWLVSRDRLKPAYAWFFLVSMIGVWLWGYYRFREVMFDFYPLVPTVMLIHCFLKVWVVSEVSHRFVEDQRNGALELLLSTPLTLEEILKGQRMALFRQFAKPVLVLCAIELAVFQSTLSYKVILPVLGILVADLFTLMWISLRLSLTGKSINEVLVKSLLWVLVVPWVVYFVLWPVWVWVWRYWHLGYWRLGFQFRVYIWSGVALVNDLLLVLCWARPQLGREIVARLGLLWAALVQVLATPTRRRPIAGN